MRKAIACVILLILWTAHLWGQESSAAPQTARQALIEMLFDKSAGTFWKHLPEATRAALEKSSVATEFHQYSAMVTQIQSTQKVQTFESGPVILAVEDSRSGDKFEMIVDHDSLRGEWDDIEVSFKMYKDGQARRTPFMPSLTFVMKKETELWTLNQVSITIRLPLTDPDTLKAITDRMQGQPPRPPALGSVSSTETPRPMTTGGIGHGGNFDAQIINAMHSIVKAENTYASTYPNVGYTCTLSNLDGFGAGEPGPNQAMLISSSLAGGRKYGYVFTLSGCIAAPAGKFLLTAIPYEPGYGRKEFCADGSGVIRSTEESNANSCIAVGNPVQ